MKEDSDNKENFDEVLTKWLYNGVPEENKTEIKVECNATFPTDYDGVTPEKSTLGKILTKHMIGIEKLKSDSDVVVTKLHKDDDKRVNYTPGCSIPLADKEITSKTVEEVSEYLDNTEYDVIINNIKKNISKKYMTEKTDGRIRLFFPKDFRERLFDLSYLPDLENRFKQFDNIGILQQELLLKSKDKDMLEGIEELTFAQVLELFIVLADMKGMIKIKDEESGEYCLKHLEKKAELIVNDIKVADITDIKISKMGVLLLTASDTVGEFGRDSKNCVWELFANLEEAIDKLKKTNTEEKVYTLLKYQSGVNTALNNIVPRISRASFGNVFAVLLDTDTLFYYRNKFEFGDEEIGLSCKPTKLKKEHNARMGKNCAYFAIEIAEEDIKTRISIQPFIPSQAQDRTRRARPADMKIEVYPTTISAEEYEKSSKTPMGGANPLANNEAIEIIRQELTEPAIEPNMDDLLAASDTDTMVVLKDGKILYVCDNNFLFSSSSKEAVIRKHAELDIGAGYEKEEFVKVDKKIDMGRFNFFKKCPSATGKNISEVYMSKEFLNDEVIIVLAKTKREKDGNKAELMFVRRGDAEYNKRFEDGSRYAVLSSSLDNELYYAIKKRIANFVDNAKLIDYINVPNLLFAYLKTHGEFDNIHYVYVDTSVHYKIKNDELDDAQCLIDNELDSLETTQIELDGYKKLTSKDYILVTPEDDIFKCPEIPRFKNEFTGVAIVVAVEDNLDVKEKETRTGSMN